MCRKHTDPLSSLPESLSWTLPCLICLSGIHHHCLPTPSLGLSYNPEESQTDTAFHHFPFIFNSVLIEFAMVSMSGSCSWGRFVAWGYREKGGKSMNRTPVL